MRKNYLTLICLILTAISLTSCAHQPPRTEIVTTVNHQTLTTKVPADQEVVMVPRGYTQCYIVPASWYHGAWIAPHKVCRYISRAKPTWISGYWRCASYNRQNMCSYWKWTPSHWSNSIVRY